MSPATVSVAGKRYPKTVLYAGGAAVVGIVGYAWWTRGMGEETEEPDPFADTGSLGDERITPTTIDTYDVSVDTRVSPRNNAEWSNTAVDRLITEGYDATAVRSAIGKFLQRIPLSKAEADLVRAALSAAGIPPENGPWVVLESQTPAAVGLSAPNNLQGVGRGTTIAWSWSAVTGATAYDTELIAGVNTVLKAQRVTNPTITSTGLQPKQPYRLNVYGINSANQRGGKATKVVNSGNAPKTTIKNLRVVGRSRTGIGIAWNPVPGATHYGIWHELGGQRQPVKMTKTPSDLWGNIVPNKPYAFTVVALSGTTEISNRARITSRTTR